MHFWGSSSKFLEEGGEVLSIRAVPSANAMFILATRAIPSVISDIVKLPARYLHSIFPWL
jgi:hypothetical protein